MVFLNAKQNLSCFQALLFFNLERLVERQIAARKCLTFCLVAFNLLLFKLCELWNYIFFFLLILVCLKRLLDISIQLSYFNYLCKEALKIKLFEKVLLKSGIFLVRCWMISWRLHSVESKCIYLVKNYYNLGRVDTCMTGLSSYFALRHWSHFIQLEWTG